MITRANLLLACLLSGRALAGECAAPARASEQAFGIPGGLLEAIAQVESGRREIGGRVEAWPWSVNSAGQGYFLSSSAEAVALVASLKARGVRSIDVGCFQVNLLHHPEAFASLDDAFEPTRNAMAAGRFLRALRDAAPGWEEAVARYHSANPGLGLPYMRQVMASWMGGAQAGAPPASRVAALVRVIVPGASTGSPAISIGLRLPVVFTPSRLAP